MKTWRLPPICWPLAGGALLLALLYAGLLHPWLIAPWRRDLAAMAELRQRRATAAAQLVTEPVLRRRMAGIRRLQDRPQELLSATEPSAASAELMQRVVEGVARLRSGRCEVVQKMPADSDPDPGPDRLPSVRVTISLRCDAPGLAALLHALEYGRPVITIGDFLMYRNATAADAALAEIQFTATGFLRPAGMERTGPVRGGTAP